MSPTEADPFDALEELLVHPSAENAQALWVALPPKLRLAMAKAAPRVAKWENHVLYDQFSTRLGDMHWTYGSHPGEHLVLLDVASAAYGRYDSFASAQSACDLELIRQGFVLDDGGES